MCRAGLTDNHRTGGCTVDLHVLPGTDHPVKVALVGIVHAADLGTTIGPQAVQRQVDGGVAFGIDTPPSGGFSS